MNKGQFKKGIIPWMKGKKMNDAQKKALSRIGKAPWNKGKKETRPEVLKKQNQSHLGQIPWIKGKKGFIPWNKGKKYPEYSGHNNNMWKGGVTPFYKKIRRSTEYKLWREAVFKRDNWICIWCGFKGYVEADHIKPFALYPELRLAIDNGRTLCKDCHEKTDTYRNNNRGKDGRYC